MLEHFDLRAMGFQSAASLQVQIEAKRLAYEDRARYYADPHFAKIPVEWLISKQYATQRAALIRPDRINDQVRPGQAPSHGDTTYFTVADENGMMISMIQSNFRGMGSGLVADGLGFMFQDRGQLFSLTDNHPNIYAPGKRPFQTIIPGFATRGDTPWMSFGVMGGDMQPMGQQQILVNRIDYGLDVQAAGDSPRWHHEGSSQSMGEDAPGMPADGLLRLESGVPDATRSALANLGWKLAPSDGGYGRYEAIEHRMDGIDRVYAAASEMRADGCAAGLLTAVGGLLADHRLQQVRQCQLHHAEYERDADDGKEDPVEGLMVDDHDAAPKCSSVTRTPPAGNRRTPSASSLSDYGDGAPCRCVG